MKVKIKLTNKNLQAIATAKDEDFEIVWREIAREHNFLFDSIEEVPGSQDEILAELIFPEQQQAQAQDPEVLEKPVAIVEKQPDNDEDVHEIVSWQSMAITDEATERLATERLVEIQKRLKKLDEQKTFLLKPFKDHIKAIEEKIRAIVDPVKGADMAIRKTLGSYQQAKREKAMADERAKRDAEAKRQREIAERARAAAMAVNQPDLIAVAKAEAQEQKAAQLEIAPVIVKPEQIVVDEGKASSRVEWKWKLVDISLVPQSFLCVNESELNKLAKSFKKEPKQVPGIQFYEVSIPVIRQNG